MKDLQHPVSINETLPFLAGEEREFLVSIDMETFFRIPTFDFAVMKHQKQERENENDDILYICTASEIDEDQRLFFRIKNFPNVLESVADSFMTKPILKESSLSNTFTLPILPSIDTKNVLIQPSSVFENFDNETGEQVGNENYIMDYSEYSPNTTNTSHHTKTIPKSAVSISPLKKQRGDHTNSQSTKNRQCLNCFCTSTPMWRRGPDGLASLCNACGVKFKSGKLQMDEELVERNLKRIKQNQQDQ